MVCGYVVLDITRARARARARVCVCVCVCVCVSIPPLYHQHRTLQVVTTSSEILPNKHGLLLMRELACKCTTCLCALCAYMHGCVYSHVHVGVHNTGMC